MNPKKLALARHLKEDPMKILEIKEDRFLTGGALNGYGVYNKAEFIMKGQSLTPWDTVIEYEGTQFYIIQEL